MNKPNTEALVYGHEELQVTDRDGKEHLVKVRAVLNRELPEFIQYSVGQEEDLARLLTGKAQEFIEQLTDESIYAINDAGARINDPRVALWTERQSRKAKSFQPHIEKRLQALGISPSLLQTTASPPEPAGKRS